MSRYKADSVIGQMIEASKTPAGACIRFTTPHPVSSSFGDNVHSLEVDEAGLLFFRVDAIAQQAYFNHMSFVRLLADYVATAVLEFVVATCELSKRVGYISAWDFGLALQDVGSTRPGAQSDAYHQVAIDTSSLAPEYQARHYVQTTRTNALELERTSGAIVERLLGLYARTVGCENLLEPVFGAPVDQ